jgi:DNA-binding LacI/PurR family transcriptional regulator
MRAQRSTPATDPAAHREHSIRASITIHHVASAAGVSIQTVSNVLNGRRGFSDQTRRRVQEAARSLGYSPSAAARSLRTGRSHSLGYLVRDIANPFYAGVARGVEDAARPRGYSLVLGSTGNDMARLRDLFDVFRELRVAGIIASTNPAGTQYAGLVRDLVGAVPFVQLGPAAEGVAVARIVMDDERGGFVAAMHLLALGRSRVGIITGPLDSYAGRGRFAGYKRALAESGIAFDPALVAEGRFDYEAGYTGVERLLAGGSGPDAIFAANDLAAIGAIARLRERRIRVPEDVAVVGYDDSEVGRLYDPPISTIAQPTYELGCRGVALLLEQLDAARDRSPAALARTEMLDCSLIVRRSSSGRDDEVDCGPVAAEAPWRRTPPEAAPQPLH